MGNKTCSVSECNNIFYGLNYCKKHYDRFKRHGNPYTVKLLHKSGAMKHPLYSIWSNMKYRCYTPSCHAYARYGGRGITVCAHWQERLNGFWNFVEDMGERPKDMTIDRIDNDGNYSCGHCEECIANGWTANCRWATRRQQVVNSRICKDKEVGVRIVSGGNYVARISINGKLLHLGTFKTLSQAKKSYKKALNGIKSS